MRNPLSLCAVALSFALASPASSAPAPVNLTFDRSVWRVVNVSGVPAAVLAKGKCAGTLVAARSDINESAANWRARVSSYEVPLHCVTLLSAANAKDPSVDATELKLTVGVSLFSGANRQFSLNGYPVAAPHDPKGSELTFVAAPPPAGKTDGKTPSTHTGAHTGTRAGTHRTGARTGTRHAGTRTGAHHAGAKPGAHAGTHAKTPGDAAAVTSGELFWMIKSERDAYSKATDETKKPSAQALAAADAAARVRVDFNLRPEKRAGYDTLVKAKAYGRINHYLYQSVSPYSGKEAMLEDGERAALAKIVKTKDAHAELKLANALLQYDDDMKLLVSGKTVIPSEHVEAHLITEKYRDTYLRKPANPGVGQGGQPVMLGDGDFAKITDPKVRKDLQDKYAAAWKAAKGDAKAEAGVNKDYLDRIAKLVAAQTPAGKPTAPAQPLDPSKITDVGLDGSTSPSDLKHYGLDQQKQYCSMLRSDGGTGPNCGETATESVMSAEKVCNQRFPNVEDKSKDQVKSTEVQKNRTACVAQINACKAQPGGGSAGTIDSTKLPKKLREYCAGLLYTPPTVDPNAGSHGNGGKPSAIDQNPCGAAAKSGTPGQADAKASAQAGADKNPCPKDGGDKKDDNFYENMGNGAAIGVAGMLFASFLGGPVLMLAVGLAAGVGAYYVSKSITEPPDKKK